MKFFQTKLNLCIVIFTLSFAIFLLTQNFSQFDKDAYIFFSKHYNENWFSLQDIRTDGGIKLYTYAPLSSQVVSLLSKILPIEYSYILVTAFFWNFLAFYSTKFFLLYFNKSNKSFIFIFLLIFLSIGILNSILEYSWMPTIFSLTFAFISFYYLLSFIKGKIKSSVPFIISMLLVAFSHYYIFYFSLFFVSLFFIFEYKLSLKKIRLKYLICFFIMVFVLYLSTYLILSSFLADWKEIQNEGRNPLTKENFEGSFLSWFGLNIITLFIVPFYKSLKKYFKLYFIAIIFLMLGLGRTTPIPQIIFGDNLTKWLMFDPFLLFSSIILTAFLGFIVYNECFNNFDRNNAIIILLLIIVLYTAFNLSELVVLDPIIHNSTEFINMVHDSRDYVLNFLNSKDTNYRYQTFGYPLLIGDFYLNTNMSTLDGGYQSFRSVDILKSSGVRRINNANNKNFILLFLNESSKYSVKYVITYESYYANIMNEQNWKVLENISFGKINVIIWENPNVVQPLIHVQEKITIFNYLWGTVPLFTLTLYIFIIMYYKIENKEI